MRDVNIDNTFAAVRQLPVEIDFASIEQFVLQHPAVPLPSNRFLQWLSNKNFLVMILTASLISAITLYFQYGSKNMIEAPHAAAQEVIQSSNSNLKPAPANIIGLPKEKENIQQVAVQKVDKAELKQLTRQVTGEKDMMQQNKEVSYSVPVVPEPILQPIKKNEAITFSNPEQAQTSEDEEDNTSTRVRTYTSCYCTFGDDDEWIKAFVREMIKDGFIKDTVNLRFTITANWLKINGKMMEETAASRYNDLYQSITGERLTSKSSISLSVNESSCSMSKNMDD